MHKKLLMVLLPLLLAVPAWSQPGVVVSIKPVHALVAGVLEGVAEPELLLSGGESPHSHALRPSQARARAEARLVFWVGPELETFLARPLRSLSGAARVVRLMDAEGVELLPARSGGVWDSHDQAHGHAHGGHGHAEEHGADPHLWLDPVNGRAIVAIALRESQALFPEQAELLAANAARLDARLRQLEAELAEQLAPVRAVPFVVFHDAYQYLEQRFGLNAAGSITLDPERVPGAQRVREVRELIRARDARCVFAEPQFTPRLVATVVEGSGARQGVLDPLGADLPPGPEAYFDLLSQLAANLRGCLEP
ncbi:zinc ABC transporter substrate-binding protein [Geoalkalibacter sp.]|uniref:zinc ABC transporter substrate-binding protein n=1 Tax=Geoalkalibacter sp. TaxID=3041440 RepID=UPI00272E1035|nr:zinc ABC transporter substrate-binding protein [Geoalkalibacter sp.]